ncbi:unnamed protein product [Rotaria sp. Silwood1]|nr:unnamed protein product [Rotaria sp. Silwood1]
MELVHMEGKANEINGWLVEREKAAKNGGYSFYYCTGLRLKHNLWGWNDYTTLVLAKDRSLLDYGYDYWEKFLKYLSTSPEASWYRETWEAYLISTSTG